MKSRTALRPTTHPRAIPVSELRWRCQPGLLGITSTDDVTPLTEIIGQDRAVKALQFGLGMKSVGFNVFVTGLSGTGRTTAVKRLLQEYAKETVELTDKCYVHNFRDPDAPTLLRLPVGKGITFKKDMASFISELQKAIPGVFESRRYAEQRKQMLEHFQDRQRSILREFEKRVKARGFEVVQVQGQGSARPEIAPVVDGNPATLDQLQARVEAGEMTREELAALLAQQTELEGQMDLVMREMRNIERKAKRSLEDLNHKIVVPVVEELLEDLRVKYPQPTVEEYLKEVEQDIVENLARFHQREEQPPSIFGAPPQREADGFVEYQVNVVVDNSEVTGRPLVIETNPRYKNLFGTIDRVMDRNGVWRSTFLHIKAGSLLKADGGFIVINALDALTEPGVWTTLKRILYNRQMEIAPFETGFFGVSSALKPEPIDLDVKVVIVGDAHIHHLLYQLDEDFQKIFKVRADFDYEMPNDAKSIASYASFIKAVVDREHLLKFDGTALAEVVEHGARLAGEQRKLSTRFSILADVAREANHWAINAGASAVTGDHVRKALDERIDRVQMVEEKIQEMIMNGSIMIDTRGSVIGQINGLSVYHLDEYEFGKPSRITAKTAMGRAGIVNIEREAEMSGPTHNKGVLILTGYLRWMFGRHTPLVLSASIAFEQSYSGVDGDSASSTEVYALLSSLSDIPIRQDLAVTGSVNQHGEIQPIGGVNQKIEGFFDVCHAQGLTRTQGVLIPHQNVKDLMLRHDVVEAVDRGDFHVYSVRTIDEGIELLTGKKPGTRQKNGKFPPGTMFARVEERLKDYARGQKRLGS